MKPTSHLGLTETLKLDLDFYRRRTDAAEEEFTTKMQEAVACGLEPETAEFRHFVESAWENLLSARQAKKESEQMFRRFNGGSRFPDWE